MMPLPRYPAYPSLAVSIRNRNLASKSRSLTEDDRTLCGKLRPAPFKFPSRPEPSHRHAVIPPHIGKENEMAHPATEKRGGNPDVKHKPEQQKPKDAMERKLEQGLEESMTGSDPVSVTQPSKTKHHEKKEG
jgi:hypothetical protein